MKRVVEDRGTVPEGGGREGGGLQRVFKERGLQQDWSFLFF